MTRGTIVFIDETGAFATYEYNGDMYMEQGREGPDAPASPGDKALALCQRAETLADFQDEISKFTEEYYNGDKDIDEGFYSAHPVRDDIANKDKIVFNKDYFEYWFSDYVYVKNGTTHKVEVTLKSGGTDWLEPGEAKPYNFGDIWTKDEDE